MVFNIENQQGGVVNNVAGDQHIHGGQHGELILLDAARDSARQLRSALAAVGLDARQSEAVTASLDEVDGELREQKPDRSRVASALEKTVGLLSSAGALAKFGHDLIGPIQSIATWLGGWGLNILQMLA